MEMSDSKAKATLSRGRQSWCVIFRHPVCLGPDGKQKLRVRRGLGTHEKEQAQTLVDQLNQILADPALWNLSSRETASKSFDEKIVAAFYDPMLPAAFDPWSIREEFIPLPGEKILQTVMHVSFSWGPPVPARPPLLDNFSAPIQSVNVSRPYPQRKLPYATLKSFSMRDR